MILSEYYPAIAEKKIPLNLLDVSSRVYFNWKKEGLIKEVGFQTKEIDNKSKRSNVYLSVYDALWILIIKELRNLNVDLNTIRELKNFIYSNMQIDDEKINGLGNKEKIATILNYIPEEFHQTIEVNFNEDYIDTILDEIINEDTIFSFKYIGHLLTSVLLLKRAVSIVIFKGNKVSGYEFLIAPNNNNASLKEKEELYRIYSQHYSNDTFINIPILPLINQLFENEQLEQYCIDFGLFNANEKKILLALNDKTCKKITVLKHDSGNITFDFTKESEIKGDKAKEIRKLLGLKQYEKIEVTYRNDKHLIVKNNSKENIINS
jgi:hypothetical protein